MDIPEEELRSRLIAFFSQHLQGFDQNLPISHQMESLQMLNIVTLLESEFGVRISSVEMTGPHFESIQALARLFLTKRKST